VQSYLDAKIRVMPDVHVRKGCTVGITMVINDSDWGASPKIDLKVAYTF